MLHKLKKQDQGFTIIEVLIVLAIAGLILLVVFMAVPALQRNSRNTQRKNDVSALLGGVTEYSSNHGGALPTDADEVIDLAKTGFYLGKGIAAGQIDLKTSAPQNALAETAADDRVVIVTGANCTAAGGAAKGAARGTVVLYEIEGSSGKFTAACQES